MRNIKNNLKVHIEGEKRGNVEDGGSDDDDDYLKNVYIVRAKVQVDEELWALEYANGGIDGDSGVK